MGKSTAKKSVLTRAGRVWKPWWLPLKPTPGDLGRWGEWVALRHLRKLGWDIVARNWRGWRGEVDLIAYDEPWLVFVEIKTGRRPSAWPPEDHVDWEKERKLDQLAFDFLLRYEIAHTPIRLDVIAVETSNFKDFNLRHYRG